MLNLSLIYGGVNSRESGSLIAPIVRTTLALTCASVVGVNKVADKDGFHWLHVQFDDKVEAWVRADKLRIVGDFGLLGMEVYDSLDWAQARTSRAFGAATAQPPASAPAVGLWPSPCPSTSDENDFENTFAGVKHTGVDLAGRIGLGIFARGAGVVVRAMKCTACPGGSGSAPKLNDPAVLNSAAWGYGLGNHVIVRHRYADLPEMTRSLLDSSGLAGAFVYVIHGHMNSLGVTEGKAVEAGTLLGTLGQSGNASGAHLHLEVRASILAASPAIFQERLFSPHLLFDLP